MRKIIYHVATTLDNFIAREDGSADGFLPEGEQVTEYLQQLQNYDTVIMGRKTYEFGYDYGLQPGQPAYPHMRHYIFSTTLKFDQPHEKVKVISTYSLAIIQQLKEEEGTPIYLCGGGNFAGFLLENELIDELWIKHNPIFFGKGIGLFGGCKKEIGLDLLDAKVYDTGVLLLKYSIKY